MIGALLRGLGRAAAAAGRGAARAGRGAARLARRGGRGLNPGLNPHPWDLVPGPGGAPSRRDRGSIGQALWGMDQAAQRLEATFSQYYETVTIRIYGQRWASVQNLYVLGLSLLVAAVKGRPWIGSEGMHVRIERTDKFIEIEHTREANGFDSALTVTGSQLFPPDNFHSFNDTGWLSNELATQHSVVEVQRRVNALIFQSRLDNAWTLVDNEPVDPWLDINIVDLNEVNDRGYWPVWAVANAPKDVTLVTHEKQTNPEPIFDGKSRGTDLTAIITQHLMSPCFLPGVPETDGIYETEAPPTGEFFSPDMFQNKRLPSKEGFVPAIMARWRSWWDDYSNSSDFRHFARQFIKWKPGVKLLDWLDKRRWLSRQRPN